MTNMVLFVFLFDLLSILSFKVNESKKQFKLIVIMDKKNIVKVILTVIKYGITLVLGYLGGNSDSVNDVVNSIL